MNKILARLRALAAALAGPLAPVRKLVGSVLGGATGVGVAAVLDAVGWHLPTAVDGALAVVLAAAGTWLAPANTAKPTRSVAVPPPVVPKPPTA